MMSNIYYTKERVIKTHKHDIKRLREQFSKGEKRLLFALAIEEVCDTTPKADRMAKLVQLTKFEIHHIIPLGLGGTNDATNLALVEPKLHTKLHQIIQSKGSASKTSYRDMYIPRLNGLVWGLQ